MTQGKLLNWDFVEKDAGGSDQLKVTEVDLFGGRCEGTKVLQVSDLHQGSTDEGVRGEGKGAIVLASIMLAFRGVKVLKDVINISGVFSWELESPHAG